MNGTVEIAGPEAMPLDELVRRFLRATQDPRKAVPDIHAHYCGGILSERSLTPGEPSRLGAIHFEDWLAQPKAQQASRRAGRSRCADDRHKPARSSFK